jgi:hypothetical protein
MYRFTHSVSTLDGDEWSELHSLASLSTGKEPPVSTGKETGWAPELVWMTWGRENS